MRHHQKNRILSRTRRGRSAIMRGLAVSLITNGKIVTTEAKAKELRPFIERLVTYGKEGTLAARRRAAQKLGSQHDAIVRRLFNDIAPKYKTRLGGYTRVTKIGTTAAGRNEAVIEFV